MLALNILVLNHKIENKLKSYDFINFNYQNNSSKY